VNTVVKERLAGEVGHPSRVSRKGESPAFRAGKGQGFPTCEPRKGHFGSFGAKGQRCSHTKTKEENIINRLEAKMMHPKVRKLQSEVLGLMDEYAGAYVL